MRTSRTILSLLLALLMLVSAVMPFSAFADGKEENKTTVAKDLSDEELPESVTLVGTKHLPPVSNQGAVGSCASQSIAYEQMTNAVSRYLHSINPDIEWDPSSGDLKYLMSPKFTYDFSGSGTAWVYNILLDHGITSMAEHTFMTGSGGGHIIFKGAANPANIYTKSTCWYVGPDELLNALKLRLVNWTPDEDQIWLNKSSVYYQNGEMKITTSTEGKQLLNKIKNAVNAGNVVVTGGLSGAWRYEKLTKSGDIGKKGEHCLAWAHSDQAGGHQVSIVGYDDNVECTVNGATMKGAFLVANSWSEDWMNDGYVWLMYDALNSKSEFKEINEKWPDRYIAMDQFCFTYWDTDIEVGLPELMVQVEVEAVNREAVCIYLVRKGAKEEWEKPYIFQYGLNGTNYHDNYDLDGSQYTFSGKYVRSSTKAETGYFTLAYGDLLATMEEGKSFKDYDWGCRIYSVHGYPINIKAIRLINSDETVLDEIEIPEGGIALPTKPASVHSSMTTEPKNFMFDLTNTTVPAVESQDYKVEYTTDTEYIAVGSKVSFKVNPAEGVEIQTVKVNGSEVTAVDGVYTFVAAETNTIEIEKKAPSAPETPEETTPPATDPATQEGGSDNTVVIIVVIAVVVIGAGVAVVIIAAKRKKK